MKNKTTATSTISTEKNKNKNNHPKSSLSDTIIFVLTPSSPRQPLRLRTSLHLLSPPSIALPLRHRLKAINQSINRSIMGRRRSNRKPPPRQKIVVPLDVLFDCPFCNHKKSCDVKMDRQRNIGAIRCQVIPFHTLIYITTSSATAATIPKLALLLPFE